jgi:hypothetical protein
MSEELIKQEWAAMPPSKQADYLSRLDIYARYRRRVLGMAPILDNAADAAEGGRNSPPGSMPSGGFDPAQAIRAEWERSPALQAEFGRFETFKAFREAEQRGLVRIHSGSGLSRHRGAQ